MVLFASEFSKIKSVFFKSQEFEKHHFESILYLKLKLFFNSWPAAHNRQNIPFRFY